MTPGRFSRREWLKLSALSTGALALGGCGPGRTDIAPDHPVYPRPLSRRPYARPRISADAVLRSVTGLRPFRPTGFRVEAVRMDGTLVVHNYGHGGGGVTLSWGSAALAVREVDTIEPDRAAVLGCGVIGLSTARLLQDRGWRVTIYARELPPHTTSNVAGALWGPTSVFDPPRLTPAFEARFAEAARISHHAFRNLVGAGYGVRWIEQFYLGADPQPLPYYMRKLPDLYRSRRDLEPHEHPFPSPRARRILTLMIEPGVYLRRLMTEVRSAGGSIVVRDFGDLASVVALEEGVVFNCTGLGAGALFGDTEILPIKGQLAFLPPDPAVDYATTGGGSGVLYMFPRSNGILLGGTFDRGNASRSPDSRETERIVNEHARLFGGMRTG